MRVEGRAFIEVLEDLASRHGIELAPEKDSPWQRKQRQERRSERELAFQLNERVAQLYCRYLDSDGGKAAFNYLTQRGIDRATASTFRIGFAPGSGTALANRLKKHGIDIELARRVGLVSNAASGRLHDRFRNRLIFPIIATDGSVAGFGGRLLGTERGPKYLNSPESCAFHKGDMLYGIHNASKDIRKRDEAILVEGNFDVVTLHRHGFTHAVAPMGTALTENQTRLLARSCKRVIVLFDGDAAGRKAAFKALPLLLAQQLDVRVAMLADGSDPDGVLQADNGPQTLQSVLDRAVPALEHLIAEHRDRMDDSVLGKAQFIDQIASLIGLLDQAVARQLYIDRVSLDLAIERSVVDAAVRRVRGKDKKNQKNIAQRASEGLAQHNNILKVSDIKENSSRKVSLDRAPETAVEHELLKLLVDQPQLLARTEKECLVSLLTNDFVRATYSAAVRMLREEGSFDGTNFFKAPQRIVVVI